MSFCRRTQRDGLVTNYYIWFRMFGRRFHITIQVCNF